MSDLNAPVTSIEEAMAREYPPATPQPCNDCPWRREAIPGWLGPYTAEKWCRAAHGESAIACHETIPDGGGWGDKTRQCRGMAIFRANVMKKPHNPTVVTGPRDAQRVFASDEEFIHYHEGGRMGGMSGEELAAAKLAREVEKVKEATGYDEESPAVLEHAGWTYGERARAIDDDEEHGVFAGDEGYMVPCQVGAAEHGNLRTALYFLADGTNSPVEVDPDNLEEA